jgi:tetratricopeptide (TPR) repeat protein
MTSTTIEVLMHKAARALDSEAKVISKQILAEDPNCVDALINLGTIYYESKQYGLAEKLYSEATKINPSYALAWFNLGTVLEELCFPLAAGDAYQQAIKAYRDYADAYYNLARVLQRYGDPRQSLRYWERYAKLQPKDAHFVRQRVRAILKADPKPLQLVQR